AISVRECDQMIEAARRAGKQLTISHQGRVAPQFPYLKELLASEDFGRLIRMVWLSGGTRTQYYFDTEEWRGTWAQEGAGTLINQKVHDLDRLSYLVGQPAEVAAFTSNLFHKVDPLIETMASASLLWENGAVGTFQASVTDGGADSSRQEYHGDRASVVYDGKGGGSASSRCRPANSSLAASAVARSTSRRSTTRAPSSRSRRTGRIWSSRKGRAGIRRCSARSSGRRVGRDRWR
ncbi:MAG: Gfo/Idh/MocA family protein, partial [Chloroflexota bacterium]